MLGKQNRITHVGVLPRYQNYQPYSGKKCFELFLEAQLGHQSTLSLGFRVKHIKLKALIHLREPLTLILNDDNLNVNIDNYLLQSNSKPPPKTY